MKRIGLPMKMLLTLLLTLTTIAAMTGCSSNDIQGMAIDGMDFGITVEGDNVSEESVFTSADIIYYEDLTAYPSGFPYGEGTEQERHSAEKAAAHTVINITQPGTYRLSGSMAKGQIRVDLGEDAFCNPDAVVNLVLDGLDLTCEVAPAILFLNVYECDGSWSTGTSQSDVDTSAAGANLIIADGSVNHINGGHVAKIYEDGEDKEKLWKQDGAIYSYMSMNVNGETSGSGVLNLNADNEGLDTELHLTINSGNINICSDNDGINTNEDGVSVTTINGGNIHILAGLGVEGDGIDSNGWLVINGGTVISSANPAADAGLDSDMGSFINGGTVAAFGSTMDWAESNSDQVTMNLQFAGMNDLDDTIHVKASDDGTLIFTFNPEANEFWAGVDRKYQGAIISSPEFTQGDTYHVYIGDVRQSFTGTDVMMGPGGMHFGGGFDSDRMPEGAEPPEVSEDVRGQRPEPPDGFQPDQMPELMNPPEGMEPPEGFDPSHMDGFGGRPGGQMPPNMGGGTITEIDESSIEFHMQDKVNAFSGVADEAE